MDTKQTWQVIETKDGDRLLSQENTFKLLEAWTVLRIALGNGKPVELGQC